MSNDTQWIASLIAEARKNRDTVTVAVCVRMEKLLGGELCEQHLSKYKLKIITKRLIADMEPTQTKTVEDE